MCVCRIKELKQSKELEHKWLTTWPHTHTYTHSYSRVYSRPLITRVSHTHKYTHIYTLIQPCLQSSAHHSRHTHTQRILFGLFFQSLLQHYIDVQLSWMFGMFFCINGSLYKCKQHLLSYILYDQKYWLCWHEVIYWSLGDMFYKQQNERRVCIQSLKF